MSNISQANKKSRYNPTPQKTERNQAIVKDHEKNGMSYSQLSIVYGITPQRCQQICDAYGTKKEGAKNEK